MPFFAQQDEVPAFLGHVCPDCSCKNTDMLCHMSDFKRGRRRKRGRSRMLAVGWRLGMAVGSVVWVHVVGIVESASSTSEVSSLLSSNTYPKSALRCYSSLTQPNKWAICPESRNSYCVKQVVSTPGALCGKTSYFGDAFEKKASACIYRKCMDKCEQGRETFTYQGAEYFRDTYCCDEDRCNGASSIRPGALVIVGALLVTVWVTLITLEFT